MKAKQSRNSRLNQIFIKKASHQTVTSAQQLSLDGNSLKRQLPGRVWDTLERKDKLALLYMRTRAHWMCELTDSDIRRLGYLSVVPSAFLKS